MHQIRGMNSVKQSTMDRMEEGRQMKGKKREKKEKSEITKHTLNNLRHTSPLSRGNPHVTA